MKRTVLLVILLFAILISGREVRAEEATYSGSCGDSATWEYNPDNQTLTIDGTGAISQRPWTDYTSEIGTVIINDGITSIGRAIFANCKAMSKITIPDSVTYIGEYAFEYCSSLYEITIPDSVTEMGRLVFYECSKLQKVRLSDNMEKVPHWLFYYCRNLVSCNIPTKAKIIEDYAFYASSLEKVSLPEGLESIGYYAFRETNLTEVTIPSTVTAIGDYAFYGTKLTSVSLPESVESLGCQVFEKTPFVENYSSDFIVVGNGFLTKYKGSDETVEIPTTVRVICDSCFNGNTTVKKISMSDSVERIDGSAFYNCTALETVEATSSLKKIGEKAFYNTPYSKADGPIILGSVLYCYNGEIEEYTIPDSVTALAPEAFFCHTELKKIVFPENFSGIDDYALLGCTGLQWLELPKSIEYIGDHSVGYKLSNGTSGEFVSQATLIVDHGSDVVADYVKNNTSLVCYNPDVDNICGENLKWALNPETQKLTITGSGDMEAYTSSSAVPFYKLRNYISSVEMEEGITSLSTYAFYYCNKIKELSIPDSVKSISSSVFPTSGVLKKIYIGTSLDYSNNLMSNLYQCPSLQEITVSKDNESLLATDGILYNKTGTVLYLYPRSKKDSKSFTIPTSVTESENVVKLGDYAFYYNKNLKKIILSDTIREIGQYTFYNCSSLTQLIFDGDAPIVSSNTNSFGTNNLTIRCHKDTCSGWSSLESKYSTNYNTVWVNLDEESVEGVKINTSVTQINYGEFLTLDASVDYREIDEVIWTSSDSGIISVTEDGLAYGANTGTATLSVSDSNGIYKDEITLNVVSDSTGSEDSQYEKYENIPITYTSVSSNCLQMPVASLNGIYFLNGNKLSFYSLFTKENTDLYTFANCKDAFTISDKLYVIDNSEVIVLNLETMRKSKVEIDSDYVLNSIAADTKGNIILYGKMGSNNYYLTYNSALELTGTYPSSQDVKNIGFYDAGKGLIIEEAYYNWYYWGYDHPGNGLYKANISDGKLVESSIDVNVSLGSVLSQTGTLLLFQNSYLKHNYNIEPLDERYFSVVTATHGTAYIFDSEKDLSIANHFSRSATEYFASDDSKYYDTTTVGTRIIYNPERDSFLTYETGNKITEYTKSGKQITTYQTEHNVFNLRMMGDKLVIFEKDGNAWNMEVIDYSDPSSITIKSENNKHEMVSGETLRLEAGIDRKYQCTYSWSSDHKDIASVSPSGVVSSWKPGNVTITATSSTGLSSKYDITVIEEEEKPDSGNVINLGVETSNNLSDENYTVYGKVINSYLYTDGQGNIYRVENGTKGVVVEKYDSDYKRKDQKVISAELPIFGGFYSGTDANYLVFGEENSDEVDSKEVLRVVKYSKNWERISAYSVKGANTYIPFDAGSLRMEETNGILYVHTCHEMYAGSDGLHHQANMTYAIKTDTMEELSSYYDVMNLDYGYVSHSFNQFVASDDNYVYRIDHGDALPRGITVTRCKIGDDVTKVDYGIPFSLGGSIGANATGASIGGFEITNDACYIVLNSVDQGAESYSANGQRNICVLILNKNNLSRRNLVSLTNYTSEDGIVPYTPHSVRINSESVLVMWEEYNKTDKTYSTQFALIDSNGDVISRAANKMRLSDCKPILKSSRSVCWYVTDGKNIVFHEIDPLSLDGINDLSEEPTKDIHSYDDGTITKEATCTEKGVIVYKCTDEGCSVSYSEEIPAKGHSFTNYIPNGDATCGKDGTKTAICDHGCGLKDTVTDEGSALKHNYVSTVTKEATCKEEGILTYTCDICGDKYTETVPKTDDHKWDEGNITLEPTCTEAGEKTYTCTVCEMKKTEEVEALGHQWNDIHTIDKEATCSEEGIQSVHCLRCDSTKDVQSIPKIDHEWDEGTVKKKATPEEDGILLYTCKKCGETKEVAVPYSHTTHVYIDKIVPPTCTEKGYTLHTCEICDYSYEDTETDALGHSYESKVTKEPTETEPGTRVFTCIRCGKMYTEEIPVLIHTHKYNVTVVAPTCTEIGYTLHTCSCGDSYKDHEQAALGHKFSEWKIVKEATTTSKGLKERTCKICGASQQEEIAEITSSDHPVTPIIPNEISPSNPVAFASVDKQITSAKSDTDPKGSVFNLLQAKGVAKSKTSVKVSWKKVSGAKAYIIYGNKCGANNSYKKIKMVTGTSFTQKNLKKGNYYKYLIVAVNGNKALATSKTIHVATKGGKVGNSKKVTTKAKKNKVSLQKGKTFKLGAKAVAQSKKLKVKRHRAIAYESSNKKIATVSGKGVIKAVAKGSCYVYAYAQNGVCRRIKVTVK